MPSRVVYLSHYHEIKNEMQQFFNQELQEVNNIKTLLSDMSFKSYSKNYELRKTQCEIKALEKLVQKQLQTLQKNVLSIEEFCILYSNYQTLKSE